MITGKEYIKPHKLTLLKAYQDFLKDISFESLENLCCYVQVGSGTNKKRVDLIKDFEFLILKSAWSKTIIKNSAFLVDIQKLIACYTVLMDKQRPDLVERISNFCREKSI